MSRGIVTFHGFNSFLAILCVYLQACKDGIGRKLYPLNLIHDIYNYHCRDVHIEVEPSAFIVHSYGEVERE